MPRKVRGPDGVVRMFPDDATDAQISEALDSIEKTGPSVMAPAPSMMDRLTSLLPAAGGTVGGIAGGAGGTAFGMGFGGLPGATAGATLGGGAGEALKQLLDRFRGVETPQTPLAAVKDIGIEGGLQGAMELGGGLAAKHVVAPAAKAVMRGYLKPSLAGVKIDKAREIVQTALDEALPVTSGGEQRAGRLITDLNKQINGILTSNPKKVDLHQVAEKVRTFAKAKYNVPGVDEADLKAALSVADSIDNHPSLGEQLYHGSPNKNLDTISANPEQRQYDNGTSQLGVFFSRSKDEAARYAGESGRVYKTPVKLKNPYVMPWSEFAYLQEITRAASKHEGELGPKIASEQWGSRAHELITEGKALREKLEREGYDGIVVKSAKGNVVEQASFSDVPSAPSASALEANKIKQSVRPNSRAFGQQGSAPEAATRKVAGSEMRQSIEGIAPEVGPLNAREGRLIDTQDAIKRAAGREENKGLNPTAVPNLIAGAFGGAEFARERDPASSIATALAVRAALSPALMTRAAILASKLAKNGYTAATAARLAVETVRSESKEQPEQHAQHP